VDADIEKKKKQGHPPRLFLRGGLVEKRWYFSTEGKKRKGSTLKKEELRGHFVVECKEKSPES